MCHSRAHCSRLSFPLMALPKKKKSRSHGVGWNALAAAVIVMAVRDAAKAEQHHVRAEARAFIMSAACDAILDALNLPTNQVLLSVIDNGISQELRVALGSFSTNQAAPTAASRARKQRSRQREKQQRSPRSSGTLVSQPLLLVC